MITFTFDAGYSPDIPDDPVIELTLGLDEEVMSDISTRLNRLEQIDDPEKRVNAARELLLELALHHVALYYNIFMARSDGIPPWIERARQTKTLDEMELYFKGIVDGVRSQFPQLDTKHAA